jgi:beta-phosphoglucomutase-like phosphatase (HAD superfamily)
LSIDTTDLPQFNALLLDLDGVTTRTATIHAAAEKQLFDDFPKCRARDEETRHEPFEIATDYVRDVDGRQRTTASTAA